MLVTDVDTIVCDDCFDVSVYKDDTAIVLNEVELKELHEALNEWVAENNIVRVELVAKINTQIKSFMEKAYA